MIAVGYVLYVFPGPIRDFIEPVFGEAPIISWSPSQEQMIPVLVISIRPVILINFVFHGEPT